VFTALGCFFSITGEFRQLAILSTASVLLIYLGVALSVIKLRKTKPENASSFVIPGGYTIPIVAIVIIVWFLSNLKINEVIGMSIFVAVLTVAYYLLKVIRLRKDTVEESQS
jgi:L-asparagine transporter-like permease